MDCSPLGAGRRLQVNFCKNPLCANFGVPATGTKFARLKPTAAEPGTQYKLGSTSQGNVPSLTCLMCSETFPVKSNVGITEEIARMTRHFNKVSTCCPTVECANASTPVPNKNAYYSFGKTDAGSVRYQCKACKKTFSKSARATLRQREPRKNAPILQSLMNKAPLSRLIEVHDISFQTLYDKLDFFYKQVQEFNAEREPEIRNLVRDRKVYLALDRQDYTVNWTHRKDKRNVVIKGVGSADLHSGYVMAMHINFDGSLDTSEIEREALAIGDHAVKPPYRRFARLWLEPDYSKVVAESAARASKRVTADVGLVGAIQKRYRDAESRGDVESPESVGEEERFPAEGMQVRSEYTMYAHFYYLQSLIGNASKIRFFLDQESGIRAACFSAFWREIAERRADVFYVALDKDLTIDERRRAIRESRERFQEQREASPELTEYEVKVQMMKDSIAASAVMGKWSDRWAVHPFPNQAEPHKRICNLTDFRDYDEDHTARLFLKASLHPIDRFFMSVRRRLNMLERPIGTSSAAGRTWHGYSAYQPENIEKLLTVFRTYYNFCLAGAEGTTPAMRFGLATRPVTPAELLGM